MAVEDGIESRKRDYECDGIFDHCCYSEINETESESEIGNYTLRSDSLFIEDLGGIEIENNTIYSCDGCKLKECDTYVSENCFYITGDGTDDDFFTINFDDDELIMIQYLLDPEDQECNIIILSSVENLSIGGCMDSSYPNFNSIATFDDGTCGSSQCDEAECY